MDQYNQWIEPDSAGFSVSYLDKNNSYTPRHWHRALELLLLVRGTVKCVFENGTHHIRSGQLFLINSHEVHETHCSRWARYLAVHIDPGMMCRFSPTFDQMFFSLTSDPEDKPRAQAHQELTDQMQKLLELVQENRSSRLEQESCLFRIASVLERYFAKPLALEESTLRRSDMSRLEPILEYIQLHHGEELQLEDAAGAMGLNKEYFCRLFKKNMGITHLQYIYQVRAAAVCRDLEYTDDPIGEIGERHGFRDGKTLNQYFKELYGCTPSEKRKFFREVCTEEEDQT